MSKVPCKYCGKKFSKFGYRNHEICCTINPDKIDKSGENSYRYGKKGTNQYLKARDDGRPLPKLTENQRNALAVGRIQKWTPERREKLSYSRSKILEEGGSGGFKNVGHYKLKNNSGEEYHVRGKWELAVAEFFNSKQIHWIRKVYLKYNDGEVNRTYTPDFYLPEHNVYIEVKGYYSKTDRDKMRFVQEQNDINIVIAHGKTLNDVISIINERFMGL